MPFQSEKQRRYLWANRPDIARKWENKYATGGNVMNDGMLKNNDITFTMKSDGGETMTYKSPKGMMPNIGILGGLVGGPDRGPTADNVMARLTPGEFVINRPAAMKYGGLLQSINDEGRMMLHSAGYAGGGMVGYATGGEVVGPRGGRYIEEGGKWYQVIGPEGSLLKMPVTDQSIVDWLDNEYKGSTSSGHQLLDATPLSPSGSEQTRTLGHQEPIRDSGYTYAHGQNWQNEVTVPAGADKYQGDPAYDLVSDDRFTGYRTYRLNPQWAEMQGGGRGVLVEGQGDRQRWQQQQQDAYNAQAQAQAGQITGQYPTRTQSMQDVAARDAQFAAAQAAGGQMRQQIEDAARRDALTAAAATAAGETQQRFKYLSGERYNAPSKEAAMQWVQAGIVAKSAIFVLPNGVEGVAQ